MPSLFYALWLASLVSVLGTATHEVAAGWLMTSLHPDPLLVALVSVASSLPFFLLVLPAGALSDLFDRRRYLLATQSLMAVSAGALAWLTARGSVDAVGLLALTFLLSVGAALNSPAWHAVTAEVVPREQLPRAITYSGFAVNGGRTLGPALGGWLIARWGADAAFSFNALSFLGVILVLAAWRNPPRSPQEAPGIRAGLRYVQQHPRLRRILARTLLFVIPASAPLALLPLLVKQSYGAGSEAFGTLVTLFGVGSLLGSTLANAVRDRWSPDLQLGTASVLYALLLALLGLVPRLEAGLAAELLAGTAWMLALNQLHTATQLATEDEWRSRATAAYLLALFGGSTLGSALWGGLAEVAGPFVALQAAAVAAILSGLAPRLTLVPASRNIRE